MNKFDVLGLEGILLKNFPAAYPKFRQAAKNSGKAAGATLPAAGAKLPLGTKQLPAWEGGRG